MLYKLLNVEKGDIVTIYLSRIICEKVKVVNITYDTIQISDNNGRDLYLDKGAIEDFRMYHSKKRISIFLSDLIINGLILLLDVELSMGFVAFMCVYLGKNKFVDALCILTYALIRNFINDLFETRRTINEFYKYL